MLNFSKDRCNYDYYTCQELCVDAVNESTLQKWYRYFRKAIGIKAIDDAEGMLDFTEVDKC